LAKNKAVIGYECELKLIFAAMKKYLFFFVFCFGLMAGQQDNPFYGETDKADNDVTQAEGENPGGPPGETKDEDAVPINSHLGFLLVVALAATYYYGRKLTSVQGKD